MVALFSKHVAILYIIYLLSCACYYSEWLAACDYPCSYVPTQECMQNDVVTGACVNLHGLLIAFGFVKVETYVATCHQKTHN